MFAADGNPVECCLSIELVAAVQVANRPFRFLRIVRTIRYTRGLRMLAATIVSAIPATLKVRSLARQRIMAGAQALSAWICAGAALHEKCICRLELCI